MKTKINIFKFILSLIAVVTFFSCDNPVALGTKLDLLGPVVTIISPLQRQSLLAQFEFEGTVYDESVIDRMVINAVSKNGDFPRQWRNKNGAWEISDNGSAWLPYADAEWTGTNDVKWKISINMKISGPVEEGEYTFNIQAWDKGGFTDENSFKAIVLIIDPDPPKVSVTNPYLYSKYAYESDSAFIKLDSIDDESDEWQDTAYLGKFITQEFSLKWQIEDSNDVRSIDLRFYKNDIYIDDDPNTPLPENYIYRYYKSISTLTEDPNDYVKLNDSVTVPNLYDSPGTYGEGELKSPIPNKTTVKIVAVCYDAAGNPNQEKTLGYFISWPKANTPWIVFTDGIVPPDDFYGKQVAYDKDKPDPQNYIEDDIFMVYPGKSIKSTAFQAHGVKEVKYSMYRCETKPDNTLHRPDDTPVIIEMEVNGKKVEIIQENIVRKNIEPYSTIFQWELDVPPITGYYVFKAEAFSSQGKSSGEYVMLFRVHDISFPDFPIPPKPIATDPLFKSINNENIFTIEGIVSDATEVKSLCLVWINPESKNYSAMSQLAYFRDSGYPGWKEALTLTPNSSKIEERNVAEYGDKYPYDGSAPNGLWRLKLTPIETDYVLNRRRYSYKLDINLDTLNIGIGKQPLKSQIFLFRAENPDGKCTIITYAPQGDTSSPVISINEVRINGGNGNTGGVTCSPGTYAQINKFNENNTIEIIGSWREDSVKVLPISTYFTSRFKITINNQGVGLPSLTVAPEEKWEKPGIPEGEWRITATAKETPGGVGQIPLDKLKDTLVISANVIDIGGNTAETGSSWLIQSDNLRLNRIYSEVKDGTYSTTTLTPTDETDTTTKGKIIIFLEFSKPVMLKPGVANPVLILNNGGRAVYRTNPPQSNQNSRQYFEYTIESGHTNVPALNVTDLENPGSFTDTYPDPEYKFSWCKGAGEEYEEVRITTSGGQDGINKYPGKNYYVRTLPTTTVSSNPDYQFTLGAGKSITIDTTLPTVSSITANSVQGFYKTGDVIYMSVNFSEAVKYTGVPTLSFNFGETTDSATSDVKVNDKSIIFKYTVKSGDTTNGGPIIVTNYSGAITDLAGNSLASDAVSSLSADNRTLTGVCIETRTPPKPVVRLLSSNTTANDANVLVNKVLTGGVSGDKKGISTATADERTLTNLYNDNLYLAIEGQGGSYQYDKIEYSIVTTDASWVIAPNITNTAFSLSQHGQYKIIACQTDKAGNPSNKSDPITFNWNPGNLVNRISSQTANGTYTHVNERNQITITVYLRNNISVTSGSITLNVKRGGTNGTGGTDLSLTTGASSNVSSLNFTYTVENGDYIPGKTKLNVNAVSITATDGSSGGNGVDVTGIIKLPTPSFDANKEFFIETGDLSHSAPVFIENNQGGTDWNDKNSTNYHGIRDDDGSYWTTLQITFNRTIYKGSGDIVIQQIAGSGTTAYRLPTVLTEAQYNRFKSVPGIETYYIKGTNGFNNSTGSSDTSTKYILDYKYNPNSAITTAAFTGDVTLATADSTFIEAFRNAEKISIPVNSQAVTITGTGASSTLKIRLSGSNAPQVPGAAYIVTLPEGLVNDELGNSSAASSPNVTLRGVAKPFVRIKKTQDVISTQPADVNTPRLTAAQPFESYARMDCRTPGSTITYNAVPWTSSVAASNMSANVNTNPSDINEGAGRPNNATGSTYDNGQITLGGNTQYQGYQWWVRAEATTTAVSSNTSVETEEKAYRTVITLQLNNIRGDSNGDNLSNGNQIWIRGGDAIGSSSVPGFPFTWEDNWSNLSRKRVGIRLMTKVITTNEWLSATKTSNNTYTSTGHNLGDNDTLIDVEVNLNGTVNQYTLRVASADTFRLYTLGSSSGSLTNVGNQNDTISFRPLPNLNRSEWKFVTWEINTTAYIDFIMGVDSNSLANIAWQYGPKEWSYQRNGWTLEKKRYPIYPGRHRWCTATGTQNFSTTKYYRDDYSSNNPSGSWVNQP